MRRWFFVVIGTMLFGFPDAYSQGLFDVYRPVLPAVVRDSVPLATMARSNIEMYAAIHPDLVACYITMLQHRFSHRNESLAVDVASRLRDLKRTYLERRRDWALHELQLLSSDVQEYALVARGRSILDEILQLPPSGFVGPLMSPVADAGPVRPGFRDTVLALYYASKGLPIADPHGTASEQRAHAEEATRGRFLALARRLQEPHDAGETYPSSLMNEYASLWYVVERPSVQDSIRFFSRYLTYRYTDDQPLNASGFTVGGLYLSSPEFSRSIDLLPPVSYAVDATVRFERWMYAIGAVHAFKLRDLRVPFNRLRFTISYAWSSGLLRRPVDEIVANTDQPAASFVKMEATVQSMWCGQMSATIPLWYPTDAISVFGGGNVGLVEATYALTYDYVYATIAPDSSKTYHAVSGESGDQHQLQYIVEPVIGVEVQFAGQCAVSLCASLRRATWGLIWYPW